MKNPPKVLVFQGLIRERRRKAIETKCPPAQLCPACNGPDQWVSTTGGLYCQECYPPVNSTTIKRIVLACWYNERIVWEHDLPNAVRRKLGLPIYDLEWEDCFPFAD